MSLETYKRKRDFKKTPEPNESTLFEEKKNIFVIQKHRARRLHYDFRLESGGVLKSWAVPKGPSMNPNEKQLAILVEDHPYSYKDFEGRIPEGQYGAGEVIVWDQGTYNPDFSVAQGLDEGKIVLRLSGEKLKGKFALVRMKNADPKNWLLMKLKDEFANSVIENKDNSVLSGKSIEQMAQMGSAMPLRISPMVAETTYEAFDRKDWIFEIKWDGYRMISFLKDGRVEMKSRNDLLYNEKFPALIKVLESIAVADIILDGEVAVVDENGLSHFQMLQNYLKTGQGNLMYYVFDMLYLNGRSLMDLPLIERKEMLRKVLPESQNIRYVDHVSEAGQAFFFEAKKRGIEGIMAKDAKSPYLPGRRTPQWLKIKAVKRQEAVIGGFTEPRGARQYFGSLILGVYENEELIYVGHCGGGFDQKKLKELFENLKPLIRAESPFRKIPKTNMPAVWVEPRLICEIKFSEWTKEGSMRQPIYLGLREDKSPREVRKEHGTDKAY